jgi:hypothetical protein
MEYFHRDEGGKGDSQHQVLVRMDDPSVSKAVRTKVLPGANFCHAILSISFIPFIPVPNLLSATWCSAGEISYPLIENREEPIPDFLSFILINQVLLFPCVIIRLVSVQLA